MNTATPDVELLMCADNDLTVVNTARVSFAKHHEALDASDETLIAYLAREGHWSPFAHPQLRFRFRMPIAITAQWFKHQVGLQSNSISRRYVSTKPEMFVPQTLRCSSADKKQGCGGPIPEALNANMLDLYQAVSAHAIGAYEMLLANGVCPEQARFLLPQGVYTEFVQTGSLAAYARIVKQRTHPHAQAEIRQYAIQVAAILRERFPICCKYLLPSPQP